MTNSNTEPKVTHNIYDYVSGFSHSLTVTDSDGKTTEGKRVSYTTIARNGNYAATTRYYPELPGIFKLEAATCDVKIKSNKSKI